MAVLPDWMIKEYREHKLLAIDPFDPASVQPASYDFRLGNRFLLCWSSGLKTDPQTEEEIDLASLRQCYATDELAELLSYQAVTGDHIDLLPGGKVLGMSREWFGLGDTLGAKVYTKSSLGRLFISVANGDAGWWDPGFTGNAVLEIVNHGPHRVRLLAGQRIGQVVFETLAAPCEKPYAGHYKEQGDFAVDKWKASLSKLANEVKNEEQSPVAPGL